MLGLVGGQLIDGAPVELGVTTAPRSRRSACKLACFVSSRAWWKLRRLRGKPKSGASFASLTPQGRRFATRCARPWRTALDRSAPLRCKVGQVPRRGTTAFPGPSTREGSLLVSCALPPRTSGDGRRGGSDGPPAGTATDPADGGPGRARSRVVTPKSRRPS